MDRGEDFLKAQINNAVMSHGLFCKALHEHEGQADDERFRALCEKYIPPMREHQRMLEEYQKEIGADGLGGGLKKAMGAVLDVARDLADATRESDFLRLVNDIVMSRQSEDTFKTFREAGKQLGLAKLAQIGDMGEKGHDDFHREANRLVQALFIEHAQEGDGIARLRDANTASPTTDDQSQRGSPASRRGVEL